MQQMHNAAAQQHRGKPKLACMSRFSTVSVLISSWSARVDLPWSMCAMMEKLRTRSGGTCGGREAAGGGAAGGNVAACACARARPGWLSNDSLRLAVQLL